MLCLCFRNVCSSSLKSSRASFRRLSRLWERMSSWAALPHAWCQAVSSLNFRTRAAASSLIRLVGGKFLAQRNKTFHAILTQKSKNDQVDINVVKWENSSLPFFSNHNKVLSAKVKCIIFSLIINAAVLYLFSQVNPPYYVKLVELVPHPQTTATIMDTTHALMTKVNTPHTIHQISVDL